MERIPMKMNHTCSSCRYFDRRPSGNSDPNEPITLQPICRRHPPLVSSIFIPLQNPNGALGAQFMTESPWPLVIPGTDWCGEHTLVGVN